MAPRVQYFTTQIYSTRFKFQLVINFGLREMNFELHEINFELRDISQELREMNFGMREIKLSCEVLDSQSHRINHYH